MVRDSMSIWRVKGLEVRGAYWCACAVMVGIRARRRCHTVCARMPALEGRRSVGWCYGRKYMTRTEPSAMWHSVELHQLNEEEMR